MGIPANDCRADPQVLRKLVKRKVYHCKLATAQSDGASSLPRKDPGTLEERMVTAVPFSLCVPECDRSFAPGRVQFPTRKDNRLICCCDESRRSERVEQTGERVGEPLELVRPSSEQRDPAVLPAGRLRVEAVSLRTAIGAEKHEPRHGAGDFLRLAFVRDPDDGPQLEGALARAERAAAAVVLAQERLHVVGQLAVHLR